MAQEHPNRISVFMRVRPAKPQEEEWFKTNESARILRDAAKVPNPEKSIIIDKTEKKYDFDRVFDEGSTQAQIFKDAAIPTLENVLNGYCGAILAYGQTGTGKTHTMQGYDKDPSKGAERGVIPRAADYIFERIRKSTNTQFKVTISFVQIYLDKLQDLFNPNAPEININPESERVELPGITVIEVKDAGEILKHFHAGEKHRVTRATKMNPTSSRGHAALIVNVEMVPKSNDGSQGVKIGKLVLVDLAGYERFANTGIVNGIAAEEAKKINASLLALGSVVNALADASQKKGQQHIPYRNAKLTRLLKDCLGGTSVTAIILTIGPCDKYSQETAGTLYFGWRAMAVKVDAKIKELFDPNQYTNNLKAKITAYTERIKTMKAFWSKGKTFSEYVAKYGDVDVDSLEEEEEIMEAIIRTTSCHPAAVELAANGSPLTARPRVIDDSVETELGEIGQVKKSWNNSLEQQEQQALSEEAKLRLMHVQDLQNARKAGVDEETLANLKKEHEEELKMMRDQNAQLMKEILRQKNKDEVVALLGTASHMNGVGSTCGNSDDEKRIAEIVKELQDKAETKEQVLTRMFELICLYQRKAKGHEAASKIIAREDSEYKKVAEQYKQRVEQLETEQFHLMEKVSALQRGGSTRAGDNSGLSGLWAQASAVNPSKAEVEELQAYALQLKNLFEDTCRNIINPSGPVILRPLPARGTAETTSPKPSSVPVTGSTRSFQSSPDSSPGPVERRGSLLTTSHSGRSSNINSPSPRHPSPGAALSPGGHGSIRDKIREKMHHVHHGKDAAGAR